MKKIMFNDCYGLTEAVLKGRKTMTRRIIKAPKTMEGQWVSGFAICKRPGSDEVVEVMALDADEGMINNILPKYKPGEVVAVAQSYETVGIRPLALLCVKGEWVTAIRTPGWKNKMFVSADYMCRYIRITNVRVERLQDISDEDCLREGIIEQTIGVHRQWYVDGLQRPRHNDGVLASFLSPREAFSALIDKVSGKGTWASNPWVFVYEFELVK